MSGTEAHHGEPMSGIWQIEPDVDRIVQMFRDLLADRDRLQACFDQALAWGNRLNREKLAMEERVEEMEKQVEDLRDDWEREEERCEALLQMLTASRPWWRRLFGAKT